MRPNTVSSTVTRCRKPYWPRGSSSAQSLAASQSREPITLQEGGKAGSALARAPGPRGGEGAGACGTCSSPVGARGSVRCYSDVKIPARWPCRRGGRAHFCTLTSSSRPYPILYQTIIEHIGAVPGTRNDIAFFLIRRILRCSWSRMTRRETHFQFRQKLEWSYAQRYECLACSKSSHAAPPSPLPD